MKSPMITNWTLGYQRELWRDAALEIRYVGNRGSNLWRFYNINETNIIENNFVQEFRNAQRNLAINVANGQTGFGNNGLPGQVALPIFDAAFGARGSQGAVAATAGYQNATFITNLQQGEAGRLANTLAGNAANSGQRTRAGSYGNGLPGCASRGFNAPGAYPINFFQANPYAAGFTATQPRMPGS